MIVVDPTEVVFEPGLVPGVLRAELGVTGDKFCDKLPHALRTRRVSEQAARRVPRVATTGMVLQPRA
jgi:hypothetical protein